MATQNWDWVFHTLGWGLAGLEAILAFWALFWDRSHGRKRCPKCWYSMEGAAKKQTTLDFEFVQPLVSVKLSNHQPKDGASVLIGF